MLTVSIGRGSKQLNDVTFIWQLNMRKDNAGDFYPELLIQWDSPFEGEVAWIGDEERFCPIESLYSNHWLDCLDSGDLMGQFLRSINREVTQMHVNWKE